MIDAFFSNPYNVIGIILLTCLGGYIAWRNAFKSRHAAACAAFYAAFEPELAIIRNNPRKDRTYLLLAAFRKHLAAVREFAHYMPWLQRRFFLRRWLRYHGGKTVDTHNLEQRYSNAGNQEVLMQLAVSRLEKLLCYAKHR